MKKSPQKETGESPSLLAKKLTKNQKGGQSADEVLYLDTLTAEQVIQTDLLPKRATRFHVTWGLSG